MVGQTHVRQREWRKRARCVDRCARHARLDHAREVLKALLVSHAAVTWFLCGLIWTIQVVHYPSFADVGREGFSAFHQAHVQRITTLVALPMLFELVTAGLMVLVAPVPRSSAIAGLVLLGIIWASTAFVQVPLHDALGRGNDAEFIARLVATNWIRTVAWTLRAGLVSWWVARGTP